MFGKKKDLEPQVYRVEKTVGNRQLENLLNERHTQGYDVVAILEGRAFGSNAGRDVVFKYRS